MRIPLSQPSLTALERRYYDDAFASGWISGTGPYVTRFEDALAAQVGRKYAIAVSNGTVALELALKCLGIGQGDEVIVPALTFVAPAAAVRNVGAKPVIVDVDPESWTLSPEHVSRAMTRRTQAIIAVDLLGHPANYTALYEVAGDIPIIEDGAQAHGACFDGIPVGKLGDVSTFSFFANKAVTTGEGGAVLTDDYDLAQRMRLIASHGMSPDRRYWHEIVGSNYRMTNTGAAIGLAQVERWQELTSARQKVSETYTALLAGLLPSRPVAGWAQESCWLYCLYSPQREQIICHLQSRGIDAREIWTAIPDLPPYRDNVQGDCTHARQIAAQAFTLPTWAGMPEETIHEIVRELIEETAYATSYHPHCPS